MGWSTSGIKRTCRYSRREHFPGKKKQDSGDDTIAAIITPPGEGGIAAIRIAGPDSRTILHSHFQPSAGDPAAPAQPFMLRHGYWKASEGAVIDEVTAVHMPEGQSYTGLEQVEIFGHGGRQVVRLILQTILDSGARMAEPGEFTRLAFLNGRIDLTRAEAVAEMIAANTAHSYEASREHLLGAYAGEIERLRQAMVHILAEIEASIDFAEEDIDPAEQKKLTAPLGEIITDIDQLLATYRGGRIIQEGYKVVLAGRPNAGKSSLFNLLLRQERALVNPTAGTTRDYLSEWIDLEGYAVNLIDTAGLRIDGDEIEKAGQNLARQLIDSADLVVWLVDLADPDWKGLLATDVAMFDQEKLLVTGNKIDVVDRQASAEMPTISYSCRTGEGIEDLTQALSDRINERMPDQTSGIMVTSARHQQKLTAAHEALTTARDQVLAGDTPDVIAFTLRQATTAIDEITGRIYTEEVLGEIFSSFCIGK
ncbi:tRNA uridine-5-carboxymethylaminomethyl(34) synthesis GTPase MnmE [candidate division GN15 bacterium]|nr:tRNA uridine-5-carboxymethylaminomethyl(34) synthesis GTPase MnmE [candidate division GN15 bacterium]